MHASIHDHNRDLVPVLVIEGDVIKNGLIDPLFTQFGAHLRHDHPGVIAEMAFRLSEKNNAGAHCSP
jgi:hypothetical protein